MLSKIRKVQQGKVKGVTYYRYWIQVPKKTLDEIGWDEDTIVEINIEGKKLIIRES